MPNLAVSDWSPLMAITHEGDFCYHKRDSCNYYMESTAAISQNFDFPFFLLHIYFLCFEVNFASNNTLLHCQVYTHYSFHACIYHLCAQVCARAFTRAQCAQSVLQLLHSARSIAPVYCLFMNYTKLYWCRFVFMCCTAYQLNYQLWPTFSSLG